MPYSGTYYPSFGRTQSALGGLSQTIQGLGQNIALEKEREHAHELAMKGLDIKRAGLEADQKMGLLNLEAGAKKAAESREDTLFRQGIATRGEARDIISAKDLADTRALTRKKTTQDMERDKYEEQPISIYGMFKENGLKDEAIEKMINSSPFEPQDPYQTEKIDNIAGSGYMVPVTEYRNPGDPQRHKLAVENKRILFGKTDRRDKQRTVWNAILMESAKTNPKLNNIIEGKELTKQWETRTKEMTKGGLSESEMQDSIASIENDPYYPAKVVPYKRDSVQNEETGKFVDKYGYEVRPFTPDEKAEKSFRAFNSEIASRYSDWYNKVLSKLNPEMQIRLMTYIYNDLEASGETKQERDSILRNYGVIPPLSAPQQTAPTATDAGLTPTTEKEITSPPYELGAIGRKITEEEFARTPAGLIDRGARATGMGIGKGVIGTGRAAKTAGEWLISNKSPYHQF